MSDAEETTLQTGAEDRQRYIYDHPVFWPVLVFLLTLATHGYYIIETVDHPFFNYPLVDSFTYHQQALEIQEHGWLGDKIFWQAPMYPYFLALCYQFIDEQARLFDIRFIQAVVAAINGVLLFVFVRRRLEQGVAIGVAVAAAFYGPLIYFDAEMLAPVLVVFFYLLMALALDTALGGRGIQWWPVAGVLNGLAALSHGLALVIAPFVCMYSLLGKGMRKIPLRKRLMGVAAFGVGVVVVIAPVTIRNRVVGGEWVLVSHNGPINLYIGNHPEYDKMVGLRPGLEWTTLQRDLANRGIDSTSGEARYFVGAVLDNFREQPLVVAGVWLQKIRLLFHADELKRNYPIYPMREYSGLMWASLWKWRGPGGVIGMGFPFGLLLPLAVVGWWTLRKRGVRLAAVELIIVGHVAANLLFFICSRYRVALAPFLVIYAAAAVQWALGERLWSGASLRRNWLIVVVALAVFLASNAGLTPMENDSDRGEYHFYLGLVAHKHRNEPEKALEHYQAALALLPDFYEAHSLLGILHGNVLGEQEKALEQFQWLLDRDPGNMQILYNKAVSLFRLGKRDEARKIVEALAATDPQNEKFAKFLEVLSEKETLPQSGNQTQKDDMATTDSVTAASPQR